MCALHGDIGELILRSDYVKQSIARHQEDLIAESESTPFVVFLCGPTIKEVEAYPEKLDHNQAAILRKRIKDQLESHGFDVVLGEDEGLEDARLNVGRDAQDNELEYITKYCDAIVIVSGSVGSFCELGLFSWHYTHPKGKMKCKEPEKDFVLLVEKQFERDKSYFNEGPANIVSAFGQTLFVDYAEFDTKPLIDRLKLRKAMIDKDARGHPMVKP